MRDFAEVRGGGVIDAAAAGAALDLLEVDHEGLDRLDREILSIICRQFGGGPVGLSTLAVAVQEESDTIEDVYEPYLLQRGLPAAHAARALRDPARVPPHRHAPARGVAASCSADRTCTPTAPASDTWVSWPPASPAPG